MKRMVFVLPLVILFSITIVKAQGVKTVNSKDAFSLLQKDKKIVVLDVRTPGEFNQGHIKNAINMDIHRPDALDQINRLDKNKEYLVYCRTKNRSGVMARSMINNGFKNVYQMTDGMTGWNINRLPAEK